MSPTMTTARVWIAIGRTHCGVRASQQDPVPNHDGMREIEPRCTGRMARQVPAVV